MKTTRWRTLVLGGLVAAAVTSGRPASATFHQVMVKEVFAGTPATPDAQYVVLQAWSAFQNLVAGHQVRVFDAAGSLVQSFVFPGPVAVDDDQMTILVATPEAEALFPGVTADLAMTAVISAAGGKVCWDAIDCVAWGTYEVSADGAVGLPLNPDGGIPPCQAIRRRIDAGDPTALDPADDTDDSAGDFEVVADPFPRNNAGDPASPPAFACPSTVVTIEAVASPATEAGLVPGAFRVTRSDSSGGDTVAYAVSGTATPSIDYVALPGTVTFDPPGSLTAEIAVTPIDDPDPELTRSVVVALSSGPDYVAGTINRARVAIVSDEPIPVISSAPAGVPSLGTVDLEVGLDDLPLGLDFAWTSSCPLGSSDGVFSDPGAATPTWRAPRAAGRRGPVICTLTATLSDGQGVVATATAEQVVTPATGGGRRGPRPGGGGRSGS